MKTASIKKIALAVLVFLVMCGHAFAGQTFYVDAIDGNDNNNGLTLEAAFATIQKGIDTALNGDTVLVADGTYMGDGNRDIDFKGKAITVRSENGPQICIIDCQTYDYPYHRGFYFHNAESEYAVLEGFTILNGMNGSGGGIFCTDGASPTIRNNIIEGNRIPFGGDGGGGIACKRGASPVIVGNVIRNNYCEPGGGGGGIHCYEAGSPLICYNVITGNHANGGGGIEIAYGTNAVTIVGNLIVANDAIQAGAITSWATNCDLTISNNTIVGNVAEFNFGGIEIKDTINAAITNCIIWGNRDQNGTIESSQITGSSTNYSCIQGWTGALGGTGNIGDDPLFVNPGGVENFRLAESSPCIDTGDPNYIPEPNETDFDGKPRVIGGRIDMGAYEFWGLRILYVDADAPQFGDGTSWATAFRHLQDALFNATSGTEIKVAEGIYKPHLNTYTLAPPSRYDTFQLINGVTIKGGYAGLGRPDPDARDISLYETILSGDMNGDDIEVAEPCDLLGEPTRAENSLHVVKGSGTDNTAVLDGFIIKSGNANGGSSQTAEGGGIYNGDGSPMLTNCTFTANSATNEGGGMYNLKSHPIVTNCTFNENSAAGVGGGGMYNEYSNPTVTNCAFVGNSSVSHGGGISNQYRSSPTISNCTFHSNSAQRRGGGVYNNSKAVLINCTFTDNEASSEYGDGGGMHNDAGPALLTSCTFIGNRAGRSGGGIHNDEESDTTMNNCTFIGNSAVNHGGGMSNVYECTGTFTNCILTGNSSANNGGGVFNDDNNAMFANCIISGNSAVNDGGGMFNDGCTPILTNCTFSGNLAGGNTGGIYNKGACYMTLTNCILWGDVPDELYVDGGTQVISYCDIQGGWTGEGNMDADPCFVELGYWDPNGTPVDANDDFWIDGDYHLLLSSPCIDTGDPDYMAEPNETDLDGNPRIIGGRVDMGAYEFWGPIYVDDDAPNDPGPGDPQVSDPLEDGTEAHPFDTIQEGINVTKDGYTVLVRQGSYLEPASGYSIDFLGKNITLTSADPTDWDIVNNTVIRGYVQFSGNEEPNCTFTGFSIHDLQYGAIYGNHTHATISYCNISGNGPCGATVIKDCDGTISNCLITDNTTVALCGIYPVIFGCNGLIKNCTIANNHSGVSVGTATIENCIIHNNTGSQLAVTNGGSLNISYSNVQGGLEGIIGDGNVEWGPGNIDTDPCFVRLGYWIMDEIALVEGDYHLRSEGWRWNTEGKSWTYDYVTSRCVDAGNPGSPLRDELMSVPRDPNNMWGINLRINMGAYGGTSQAGMPPYDWALLADLNNDGMTNFMDFAYQTQDWLTTAPEQPGDLNRDGVLNTMDLARLANDWLKKTTFFIPEPGVPDVTPPAPNPAIITIGAISSSSIMMISSEAFDESGVQYYFEALSAGGHDSGWLAELNYTDVTLVPDTVYCYRIMARDTSDNYNETIWSPSVCTSTPPPTDTLPPLPDPMQWDPVTDANGYDGTPREVYLSATDDYGAAMRAIDAEDQAPPGVPIAEVEYYFQCLDYGGFDSGWRTVALYPNEEERRTYTVRIGPSGHLFRFRVRARDASDNLNTTDWSVELPTLP